MTKPEIKNKYMFKTPEIGFEQKLYILYEAKNPAEKLVKLGWKKTEFAKMLQSFSDKYGSDADELVEYFSSAYAEYYSEYRNKKTIQKKLDAKKEEEIKAKRENAEKIVNELYESGMSLTEFVSNHLEYDRVDVTDAIKHINSKEEAKKIIKYFEDKETIGFKDYLWQIYCWMQRDDFDIVDYFLATKLSLYDFKRITGYEISGFLRKYRKTFSSSFYRTPKIFQDNLSEQVYKTTEDIKIGQEENEAIFKFMDLNQIPYTEDTYLKVRERCINYLKENPKVKTK